VNVNALLSSNNFTNKEEEKADRIILFLDKHRRETKKAIPAAHLSMGLSRKKFVVGGMV